MSENMMLESPLQNSDTCAGEIMLFGVRVKIDPMRKSVSMNNLSQYVHMQPAAHVSSSNSNDLDSSAAVAAESGYASADDAARNQSNNGRERKRGVPWTEDEHKLFLLGLKKVGKGDWRGISRNFVKTRTPTQVASHAQKYFLRRSNLNRRRRRSSLFDITTDSVAAISMEEQEDNHSQPMQAASSQISPLTVAAFPVTVGPVPSPQISLPTPGLSTTRAYNTYVDQKHERDSLSLSLSLNLSLSCDHSNETGSSARYTISGFNNGDGIISVG